MDYPKRKQIRLPDYDYSAPGAYFVTICTENRRCILSRIAVGAIHESPATPHPRPVFPVGAGALDGPLARLCCISRTTAYKYIGLLEE